MILHDFVQCLFSHEVTCILSGTLFTWHTFLKLTIIKHLKPSREMELHETDNCIIIQQKIGQASPRRDKTENRPSHIEIKQNRGKTASLRDKTEISTDLQSELDQAIPQSQTADKPVAS